MIQKIQLRRIQLGIFLSITLIVLCYIFIPDVQKFIDKIFAIMLTVDTEAVRQFIASHGNYAMGISFLLMVLQGTILPMPAFLITFANASLFGPLVGGVLSWSSSMVGATCSFYLSRIFGREWVEKLMGKALLDSMDVFFQRYGKHTILICRLLPFVPFKPISYAAGLTSIRFRHFIIGTGLGQLPATIIYSYIGGMLTGGLKWLVLGLSLVLALFVLTHIIRLQYQRRYDTKSASMVENDLQP